MRVLHVLWAFVSILSGLVGVLSGYIVGHRRGRSEMLRALQVVRAPGVPDTERDLAGLH